MHVTEKEVDDQGVHILSSTLEADGPLALVSPQGKLDAKVIALRRTDSGGVFLQTAVTITEPVPQAPAPPPVVATPEETAATFLESTGLTADEAKAAVAKFGAEKILAKKGATEDAELDALLAKK